MRVLQALRPLGKYIGNAFPITSKDMITQPVYSKEAILRYKIFYWLYVHKSQFPIARNDDVDDNVRDDSSISSQGSARVPEQDRDVVLLRVRSLQRFKEIWPKPSL